MTKKFSELDVIVADDLAPGDLFALADVTEGNKSWAITFDELTKAIISPETFTDPTNTEIIKGVIDGINAYKIDNRNTLNATFLYDDRPGLTDPDYVAGNPTGTNAYQPGSYFLNYTNLINKPFIPTDLNDLTNESGFLRYDEGDGGAIPPRIIWEKPSGATLTIDTDDVPEGGTITSNKYYTDDRVEAFFDANFADYYNQLTASFDNGLIRDSVFGVTGTFQEISELQSNKLKVFDLTLREQFQVGQTLRLYGASGDAELQTLEGDYPSFAFNTQTVGFETNEGTAKAGTFLTEGLSYRVCLFDFTTGKVTNASPEQTEFFGVPSDRIEDNVYDLFNTNYFVRISFSSVPANKGILIYRKNNTEQEYKLLAVLGSKEVAQGTWIDYHTFDFVPWSGKNLNDNTYVFADNSTNVIHFNPFAPSVSSTGAARGWVDVVISEIVEETDGFTLVFKDALGNPRTVFINDESNTCQICHNDTALIQTAINSNSAVGRKSILLNAKTYVSGRLVVPDKFGIQGTTAVTKIIKLPWSGGEVGTNSAKMIETQTVQGASTITLVGVDFDGNATNQFLFPDDFDKDTNYLIDLGADPEDVTIDRVRILNAVGGGVYMSGVKGLKLTTSEVRNSGTTDRYLFSPVVADVGKVSLVTSCVFENYTDYLNFSLTDKGMLSNNIVNNCGSGLFIYGSRFLVSSPNVLVGPANEFLPTPDILNSEYDVININLSTTGNIQTNGDYLSDAFVYQENGEIYDLTQTDGTISEVEYESFTVKKLSATGIELVYDSGALPIPFQNVIDSENDLKAGVFRFRLTQATINSIKQSGGSRAFDTLYALDNEHQGWGWTASYRHEVAAADIINTANGVWLEEDFNDLNPRYVITTENVKYLSEGQKVKFGSGSGSHVGFSTATSDAADITFSGSTITSTVTDLSGFRDGETIVVKGTASNDKTFIVNGTPTTNSLTVSGSFTSEGPVSCKIFGEYGFVANAAISEEGIVESLSPVGDKVAVTIRFYGANSNGSGGVGDGSALTSGSGGTLNIIDKFVLAQGRIY